MKRYGQVLASGILMIIGSFLCLVASGFCGLYLYEYIAFMSEEVVLYNLSTIEELVYLIDIFAFGLSIIIYIAEFVLFMIFGIKLIIKYAKKKPLDEYKRLVVTSQVFGYVGAGLCIGGSITILLLVFGVLLTSAILLSVALSKNKKANILEESQKSVLVKNNEQSNVELNSLADEFSRKIKNIQALKDENIITQDEYINLIHKVLGIECNNENPSVEKQVKKAPVKSTTKKTKINTKDNK